MGRAVATGIDRVEIAYLRHVLDQGDRDSRFLMKTTRGFLLLSREGGAHLAAVLQGQAALGRADILSRLYGRGRHMRHRAEAALRPFAVDRAPNWGLRNMVRRQSKTDPIYINVGHANLSQRVLSAISAAHIPSAVMIHDLIPLTHPETVVPDLPPRFAARIDTVRQYADLVICNSADTQQRLAAHWADAQRQPACVTARLGLPTLPDAASAAMRDPKSFVMLGTIEPRKNHTLILGVWERLAQEMPPEALPHLHIIGPRGWHDDAFFDRLTEHPLNGTAIFEHGPLEEPRVQTHLSQATALLFPSLAEGYGYPPLEALAQGTLPIVSDLPVLRESLGVSAVYVPPNDAYSWYETIKKRLDGSLAEPDLTAAPRPSWRQHFETVEQALAGV